ncbi:MAG: YceI family protein [Verrucomicrobiota bacterium]
MKLLSIAIAFSLSLAGIVAADTYKIDPAHSTVGFSIAHLVISEVTGRFNEFEGELTVDPALKTLVTGGNGVIQAKSIDTGIKQRDDHLRGADFFDVEKFPTLSFTSTSILLSEGKPVFVGKFTMHGVTKDISVPVTVKGPIKDPWGKTRIAFTAKTTLNRKDYGLTYNKVLEAGGLMLGEDVTIEIKAEAVKQ